MRGHLSVADAPIANILFKKCNEVNFFFFFYLVFKKNIVPLHRN